MKRIFILLLSLFIVFTLQGKTLKVLFIGNSYTDVNNLPEVVKQIALNLGDTLIYQKSVPGGYTFNDHSSYAPTLQLINQGGWDCVVLQEQSQFPSFPLNQVQNEVFPYAKKLDSLIHVASPCAQTVFYMTWGRKEGDSDNCPQWPPVCTYQGMDSLLQLRYTMMADSNNAWISPVGKIWHYIRDHNPAIELYAADGSHPSASGSYLAALSFYAVLFGKDPSLTTFTFGINQNDATTIKHAAKLIAYDSLTKWRSFDPPLKALYTYTSSNNSFAFQSDSEGSITGYEWNFGDGTPHSNAINPSHDFATPGNYQVCLTVSDTCGEDTYCKSLQTGNSVGVRNVDEGLTIKLYPNPVKDVIQFTGIALPSEFCIYNDAGLKLKSGRIDSRNREIRVNTFPSGVYYLRLANSNGSYMLKWLKN